MTPDPVVLRPDDTPRRRDPQDGRRRVPPRPGRRRRRAPDRGRLGGRRLPVHRQRPRVSDAAPSGRVGIAVLADDLIWATRLADGVPPRGRGSGPGPVAGDARRGPAHGGRVHRRPDRSCLRRHRGDLDRAGRRGPGDRRRPARRRGGATRGDDRGGVAGLRVPRPVRARRPGARGLDLVARRGPRSPSDDRRRPRRTVRRAARRRAERLPKRPGSTPCWSAWAPSCATSPATSPCRSSGSRCS